MTTNRAFVLQIRALFSNFRKKSRTDLLHLPLELCTCLTFTSNNFYDFLEVTFASKQMTFFVYDDSIILKWVISEAVTQKKATCAGVPFLIALQDAEI